MTAKTLAKSGLKKSSPVQKSNMKSVWGIMKDKVVESNDCWAEDLEKTIKL
jgi:hypothetical protein